MKTTLGVLLADACSNPTGVAEFTDIALRSEDVPKSLATRKPWEAGLSQLALYSHAPVYPNIIDKNKRAVPNSSDCLNVNFIFRSVSKMLPNRWQTTDGFAILKSCQFIPTGIEIP
jgi:hypothetical protein